MNATFWIVGEIIVGIAVLGVLSAVVTAVMVPFLDRVSKRRRAVEILDERYAKGELTSEIYQQMRRELGIRAATGVSASASMDQREATTSNAR